MKRVLLADDDADDRFLFQEVFNNLLLQHYHLECVDDGKSLLHTLQSEAPENLPHLIVLDQNMPLMSGKETLAALKKSRELLHIPVIIYSTHNDEKFIEECKRLGVCSVVSKPVSYEGYIEMIRKFLEFSL
jgi:CheY-like chemotaxis protein